MKYISDICSDIKVVFDFDRIYIYCNSVRFNNGHVNPTSNRYVYCKNDHVGCTYAFKTKAEAIRRVRKLKKEGLVIPDTYIRDIRKMKVESC